MSVSATILLYAFLAGTTIPLGGMPGNIERIQPWWLQDEFRLSVIAFGGGVLLAAVSLVLVSKGSTYLPTVWALLAFASGGLAVFLFARSILIAATLITAARSEPMRRTMWISECEGRLMKRFFSRSLRDRIAQLQILRCLFVGARIEGPLSMLRPTCWKPTRWLIVALGAVEPGISHANSDLIVAGYVENAWFKENSIAFKAKLDTGAKSSSINAPNYEEFRRDERDWVRFEISNSKGRTLKVERPVVRFVRIRRSGIASGRRPVIMLNVCVAGKTAEVEFNLGDREEMNYQVLIGRTFLAGRMLVNSGETFLASNLCR